MVVDAGAEVVGVAVVGVVEPLESDAGHFVSSLLSRFFALA